LNSTPDKRAWSILNAVSSIALEHVDSNYKDQRTAIEASRIACLNLVLDNYMQINSMQHGIRCLDFSYLAEHDCLIPDEVESLAEFLSSEFEGALFEDSLKPLTIFETASLLTEIHSLGSFFFPSSSDFGKSPRILGAFYTPQEVSDYIAEKTIGPTLDSLISKIPKQGLENYYKILNFKVLDPACGSGAFLVSALKIFMLRGQRLLGQIAKVNPQSANGEILKKYTKAVLGNLYGVDLDAGALELSKIVLRLISDKLEISDLEGKLENNFRRGNALISLKGYDEKSNHTHFFSDPYSRYPFEWFENFPEIKNQSGFDFILMNPPYDRLKPNRAEFLRERISDDEDLDFTKYKNRLGEDLNYFRNSGEYEIGNKYSIDTYRLFIERSLSLIKQGGHIGFIVPSTLLGDISAAPLRRELILQNKILLLNEFPEGAKIFPGVTQSVCIMVLERGGVSDTIDAAFGLDSIEDTKTSQSLQLKLSNIETSMGKSLVIPRVNNHEWKILEKLHRNPSLESLHWLLCRRGELDLTLHSEFITNKHHYSPLIRGSHITRYSLNFVSSKVKEFVSITSFKDAYKKSERIQHIESPRIACQQISNRAQRWRLKFSPIMPGTVLANSCNYILTDSKNDDALNYLLGILNSDLLNWRFDISNTNNHVSNRELNALPIVDYTQLKKSRRNIVHELKEEVARLIESNEYYSPFIEGSVFHLYGLNRDEADIIMRSRSATKMELERTLSYIEYHKQNE
jgi:adenine-specific DNA-methyltransferase